MTLVRYEYLCSVESEEICCYSSASYGIDMMKPIEEMMKEPVSGAQVVYDTTGRRNASTRRMRFKRTEHVTERSKW